MSKEIVKDDINFHRPRFFSFFYRFTAAPSYVEPPVTPGHEFSGHVVALGPGAGEHHNVQIGMCITYVHNLY